MKHLHFLITAALLGTLAFVSCSKDEVVTTGTIAGLVTEFANPNQPISGATVVLSSKGLTKTTGSDGRFEFQDLEPGTYTLQVQANGYQTTTKQVTVYAQQSVTCDFQLKLEKIVVEITPQTLVFGKDVEQLSFSITNKSSRTLDYTISNPLDYIDVTPPNGNMKSNAVQSIGVHVKNRNAIKENLNGQLTVHIGDDSYVVSISVLGINETPTTGSIAGTVTDYANANVPIVGATVSMSSTGKSQTTSSDGRYGFNDLVPGTYTITVSANGYESVTKDIKVEAGLTTTCDFQLQKGAIDVSVTPENLIFASDVEQLSFVIRNNNLESHEYTVSNIPDFVTVSQTSGVVAAKGSQVVSVTVLNRKTITANRSGQLTVTVGNNAFIVSLNVEAYKKEAVNVEVAPQALVFDRSTNQLSFSIESKTNRSLDYTITTNLDILSISPTSGTLSALGKNAISVNVKNRQAVTIEQSGMITIAIEGNTYHVSVKVDAYQEDPVNVTLNPLSLTFDKSTSSLSFTLQSNTGRQLNYTITSDLDVLSISPSNGTLSANSSTSIHVNVPNRQNVTTDYTGQITVTIEGNTYHVSVKVDAYQEDPTPTGGNVTRGLQAYYTFDQSNADDSRGNYHGFQNGGTYTTDTPQGSGKALSLKSKQYISIGSAPFDGKTNYSLSMWVKDFGTGCIVKTKKSTYVTNPTLCITEDMKLQYYTGQSNYDSAKKTFSADMSNYQSGQWVMVTIVTEFVKSNQVNSILYINGRRADAGTSYISSANGGTAMEIGGTMPNGSWSSAMKIDNLRFYSVTLTDEEVMDIYNYEK